MAMDIIRSVSFNSMAMIDPKCAIRYVLRIQLVTPSYSVCPTVRIYFWSTSTPLLSPLKHPSPWDEIGQLCDRLFRKDDVENFEGMLVLMIDRVIDQFVCLLSFLQFSCLVRS